MENNNKFNTVKGIDKITLSNLKAEILDFEKLIRMRNVDINYDSYGYIGDKPPDNRGYKIVIKDNKEFSDLVILNNYLQGSIRFSCVKLTLCVQYIKGNNIQPLTYTEYNSQIKKIIGYIEDKYKIRLITQDMELDYLELNMNISLKHKFKDYDRPIKLILSLITLRQNKVSVINENNNNNNIEPKSTYYSKSNNSIEHVFYLKKPSNQGIMDTDTLRYEIRFKNKKKIKYDFKTAKWNELNDAVFDEYLKRQSDNLTTKYRNWLIWSKKWIIDSIKLIRQQKTRGHMLQLISEILDEEINSNHIVVLDKKQIYAAIDKLKDTNGSRMKKDIKNYKRYSIKNKNIHNDILSNNSLEKASEIIEYFNKLFPSNLTS